MFNEREICTHNNGSKTFTRAHGISNERKGVSVDKYVKMQHILTSEIENDVNIDDYISVNGETPNQFRGIGLAGEEWCWYRLARNITQTHMKFAGNNVMGKGSNNFHYSEAIENGLIRTCTNYDTNIITNYGIKCNERYWLVDHPLPVALTGDEGSKFGGFRVGSQAANVLFLHILSHVEGLQHFLQSLIILMFAIKDEDFYDDSIVINIIQYIGKDLGQSGYMKFFNDEFKFWILYEY